MTYRYIDDSFSIAFIKGTKITVEEIVEKLDKGTKTSESDIADLLNNPKYNNLKIEHINEALVYFESNKREVLRRILFKEYLRKSQALIEQAKNAERISAEDLMITINTRYY